MSLMGELRRSNNQLNQQQVWAVERIPADPKLPKMPHRIRGRLRGQHTGFRNFLEGPVYKKSNV